jgi:hypothetical protein
MNILEVKQKVLAEQLAIKNNCSVGKLQKTLDAIFGVKKWKTSGHYKYYIKMPNHPDFGWLGVDDTKLESVNTSDIKLNSTFQDKVLELRKMFTNDDEFKIEVAKLINN